MYVYTYVCMYVCMHKYKHTTCWVCFCCLGVFQTGRCDWITHKGAYPWESLTPPLPAAISMADFSGWNTRVGLYCASELAVQCSGLFRLLKFPLRSQLLFWWVFLYMWLIVFPLQLSAPSVFWTFCVLSICDMESFLPSLVYLMLCVLSLYVFS